MSHRVNLTLPPELYASLSAYAAANKSTPSTIVRDLLLELSPLFDNITACLNEADASKKDLLTGLQSTLIQGISTASSISHELQQEITGL